MMEEENDGAETGAPKVIDGGDPTLAALVLSTSSVEVLFPITLLVQGSVVTGNLASGRRYFEALEGSFKEFFGSFKELDEATVAEAAQQFTGAKDNYGSDVVPDTIGYIHLIDATVYQGGQPISKAGTPWRGKLASVDGFIFGKLVPEKN